MGINAISIIILFGLAFLVAGGIVLVSAWLSQGQESEEKLIPYECGPDPIGTPHRRFPVKYFLVAILFIIFEVEVAFLYPWAAIFREFSDAGEGIIAFTAAAVFLAILLIGLIYAWGRGALTWEE